MPALTFVRPGELRAAEWADFDFDAAIWSIPAERMKMRRPHRIPLAPRAVAILRDLHAITGAGKLLFPSVRSAHRPMSEITVNAALRRLGFGKEEITGHGFRSAASSILNESGLWHAAVRGAGPAGEVADRIKQLAGKAFVSGDERLLQSLPHFFPREEARRRVVCCFCRAAAPQIPLCGNAFDQSVLFVATDQLTVSVNRCPVRNQLLVSRGRVSVWTGGAASRQQRHTDQYKNSLA